MDIGNNSIQRSLFNVEKRINIYLLFARVYDYVYDFIILVYAMTPDDQYSIDYTEIDTHLPITSETVQKAMAIVLLTGDFESDYELLCKFLEPQYDEGEIIRQCLLSR